MNTVDEIRTEISRLEGELSRLSGEPILVWDGREGSYGDIPPGGALLDYEVRDQAEFGERWWYHSLGAAKAALLLISRRPAVKGEVSKDGLYMRGGNEGAITAYITRR